jgi:hypothetical protein
MKELTFIRSTSIHHHHHIRYENIIFLNTRVSAHFNTYHTSFVIIICHNGHGHVCVYMVYVIVSVCLSLLRKSSNLVVEIGITTSHHLTTSVNVSLCASTSFRF